MLISPVWGTKFAGIDQTPQSKSMKHSRLSFSLLPLRGCLSERSLASLRSDPPFSTFETLNTDTTVTRLAIRKAGRRQTGTVHPRAGDLQNVQLRKFRLSAGRFTSWAFRSLCPVYRYRPMSQMTFLRLLGEVFQRIRGRLRTALRLLSWLPLATSDYGSRKRMFNGNHADCIYKFESKTKGLSITFSA